MKSVETRGLVLYTKNYREKDKLVKIFTESFGKRMFFVKNFAHSKYSSSLQNFTSSNFTGTINDVGLSFLDDVGETVMYKHISEDIFLNAHASYIISLADAAIPDNQYDPALYGFLIKCLDLLNQGFDKEIITNIFELQVLNRFGVSLNCKECAFCHSQQVLLIIPISLMLAFAKIILMRICDACSWILMLFTWSTFFKKYL